MNYDSKDLYISLFQPRSLLTLSNADIGAFAGPNMKQSPLNTKML